MAPTLRSAQNTPSKNSSAGDSTLSTPSRKAPTCSKCKRPRAGHPRSGCPFIDQREDTPEPTQPATNNLVDAIGSMVLEPPSPLEDRKPIITHRRRSSIQPQMHATVDSLTSEEARAVDKLFDGKRAEESETPLERVAKWSQALTTPKKVMKSRIQMPGALDAPSPYSSFATDPAALPASQPASQAVISHASSGPPNSPPRAQPLTRSLSVEERDMFTAALTKYSDATIYAVPLADVLSLKASAIRMNFFVRIVAGKDGADDQALLILGKEEAAVQQLAAKVEAERQKPGPSRFRTLAKGVVFGAIGTFATLAFT